MTARHFDSDPIQRCGICGKQVSTKDEMGDHIVEEHPDSATPDLGDSYNQRRRGAGTDQAA